MMPLTLAEAGADNIIRKVSGNPEVKNHLESLGFVVGGTVKVVSEVTGNLIVDVKGTRVAISKELANRISI